MLVEIRARRRYARLATLVALLAVCGSESLTGAFPRLALASPQFSSTFQLTYSAQAPKTASGIDASITWSDPGEPFGKPREIQKMRIAANPGARLDTSALPACKATDVLVKGLAERACPASTRLGSVKGEGVLSTGLRFEPFATLFNARKAIIVVVTDNGRLITNFRDDVGREAVTVNLKIPIGISLTSFTLHLPRHLERRRARSGGAKRKAYFTTPPSCPASGSWTTTATFFYRDGSSEQRTATTPCRSG